MRTKVKHMFVVHVRLALIANVQIGLSCSLIRCSQCNIVRIAAERLGVEVKTYSSMNYYIVRNTRRGIVLHLYFFYNYYEVSTGLLKSISSLS